MSAILAAARVTKGALYHHFDNKEALARIIREYEEMGRQKKPPLLQTC